MNFGKLFGILLLAGALIFGGACATVSDDPLVLTSSESILEGAPPGEVAIVPVDQLPDNISEHFPEGTDIVVTGVSNLKDGAAAIPLEGVDLSTKEGIQDLVNNPMFMDAVWDIASTAVPGLAVWEGLWTLLSKRKQSHYANAVKNLGHGKLGVGESLKSVAKAVGGVHTEEDKDKTGKEAPKEAVAKKVEV